MGFLTNRTLSGQICPPLLYDYWRIFLTFFLTGSRFGCKGAKSKSTTLYLNNYSPEKLLNNHQFLQKSLEIKNSLFRNQIFIQKRPAKIKPRHIGCTVMAIHEKSMNINMC